MSRRLLQQSLTNEAAQHNESSILKNSEAIQIRVMEESSVDHPYGAFD